MINREQIQKRNQELGRFITLFTFGYLVVMTVVIIFSFVNIN
jgi:hypothetical protein